MICIDTRTEIPRGEEQVGFRHGTAGWGVLRGRGGGCALEWKRTRATGGAVRVGGHSWPQPSIVLILS